MPLHLNSVQTTLCHFAPLVPSHPQWWLILHTQALCVPPQRAEAEAQKAAEAAERQRREAELAAERERSRQAAEAAKEAAQREEEARQAEEERQREERRRAEIAQMEVRAHPVWPHMRGVNMRVNDHNARVLAHMRACVQARGVQLALWAGFAQACGLAGDAELAGCVVRAGASPGMWVFYVGLLMLLFGLG